MRYWSPHSWNSELYIIIVQITAYKGSTVSQTVNADVYKNGNECMCNMWVEYGAFLITSIPFCVHFHTNLLTPEFLLYLSLLGCMAGTRFEMRFGRLRSCQWRQWSPQTSLQKCRSKGDEGIQSAASSRLFIDRCFGNTSRDFIKRTASVSVPS